MTSFTLKMVVSVSEVLACNHLQVCLHTAIRSDIHTVYQFFSWQEIKLQLVKKYLQEPKQTVFG